MHTSGYHCMHPSSSYQLQSKLRMLTRKLSCISKEVSKFSLTVIVFKCNQPLTQKLFYISNVVFTISLTVILANVVNHWKKLFYISNDVFSFELPGFKSAENQLVCFIKIVLRMLNECVKTIKYQHFSAKERINYEQHLFQFYWLIYLYKYIGYMSISGGVLPASEAGVVKRSLYIGWQASFILVQIWEW